MPTTIKAQPNQNMQDVIVQATGSMEAAMQFCIDNDISISDVPDISRIYIVSDTALALGNANILRQLQQSSIILATQSTPAPATPTLNMQVVLKGGESVSGNHNSTTGENTLKMVDPSGLVIHKYDLLTDWLTENTLYVEQVSNYEADAGAGAYLVPGTGTMESKTVGYSSMISTVNDVLAYSNLTNDVVTLSYSDEQGNVAIWAPVIYMTSFWGVTHVLLATLDVALVSSDDVSAVLRLTKSHSNDMPSHFLLRYTAFIIPLGVIAMPDPDDAGNPDKCIVETGKGTYTFGVNAGYYNGGPMIWPESRMTMCVEIA